MVTAAPVAKEPAARTAAHAGVPGPTARPELASFPSVLPTNPYQRLLYEQITRHGFRIAPPGPLDLRWLWSARRDVGFLHFHWPQTFWLHEGRPERLRRPLSYVKLGLFGARLAAARALGYRVVWTVHQVFPHEVSSKMLDRLGAKILGRLSHVLIAHDNGTAEEIGRELGRAARKVEIVRHGSYIGVYSGGRPRADVRAQLGVPDDAFVFLCFGDLRAYKGIAALLEAFRAARLTRAVLVVAGAVRGDDQEEVVRVAARDDERIKPLLEFMPEDRVAELFAASDAAVVARSDGGTSGSLILALSMGLPVVAARTPVYAELTDNGAAGWLFEPDSVESLSAALGEAAASAPELRRTKARTAFAVAERLRWPEIGARTAELLVGDAS